MKIMVFKRSWKVAEGGRERQREAEGGRGRPREDEQLISQVLISVHPIVPAGWTDQIASSSTIIYIYIYIYFVDELYRL